MYSMIKHLNQHKNLIPALLAVLLVWPMSARAAQQQGEHPPAISPTVDHHPSESQPATNHAHQDHASDGHQAHHSPSFLAAAPFVCILLCIALLPIIHKTEHWWHQNKNKFIVSIVLAGVTLLYYLLRGTGFHHAGPGMPAVKLVLDHAVIKEYIPFIVLLFSLYTISGGIQLRGDLKATPATNVKFLAAGALMASFVGTTGASMLLIRPLLQTNSERKYVRHTVIFFIFLVSNIGGSLLPIGDPPLFLGYLRGVPFMWTMGLWPQWLFCCLILLVVYYCWDKILYNKEPLFDHMLDETQLEPLRIKGTLNFVWLLGVVLAVALLVPGKKIPGTDFVIPKTGLFSNLREMAQLFFVAVAWLASSPKIREQNKFDFFAIIEVAALFIGIFITMQVPIEILQLKGAELGLSRPVHFFWATGILSSFLDNAPTYVVYFETAGTLSPQGMAMMGDVATKLGTIPIPLLTAISLGAVFMGANTYIGNGPNFMVKSIAEQSGIKMPSFFGYMLFSGMILIPIFLLVTFVFLR